MRTFLYPVQEMPEKVLNANDKTGNRAEDNINVIDLTAEIRQM